MSDGGQFTIELEHLQDYEFKVRFDWDKAGDILMDEPAPLGARNGPNASRMLAAAVGNCLSASLMFCVAKAEVPPGSVHAAVTCKVVRNERGRLRVGGMDVRLTVSGELAGSARMKRCLNLFEDFCVVTASIREGIPVNVEVLGAGGEPLRAS